MSINSTTIAVRTPSASYDVLIGSGLLRSLGERLDQLAVGRLAAGKQRLFVVTSPEIWRLWGDPFRAGLSSDPVLLSVPRGEKYKRLSTVERLAEEMAGAGADRDSLLVALGGGVIGDMTGFLAAIYMRGVPFVHVPTTALAQIDSSVGGKTGTNLAAGKNLVGAFHHPLAVYADVDTLSTLPPAELRAGLQEAVKAGIICSRALFDFLETEQAAVLRGDIAPLARVIAESVRVKANVVAADEREANLRMILNLGHTLGHAIEAATGYSQLLHGEAIAWGMIAAIGIALRRGMVSREEADRMERVIIAYGPLQPFTAEVRPLVDLTAKDKKNRSGMRSFVLPVGIGDSVVVQDVTEDELLGAAEAMMRSAARMLPRGATA